MDAITYAKAGGPPAEWYGLKIINLDTGEEVRCVEECNTAEGWLVRLKLNAEGQAYLEGEEVARERIEGRFEIRRPT